MTQLIPSNRRLFKRYGNVSAGSWYAVDTTDPSSPTNSHCYVTGDITRVGKDITISNIRLGFSAWTGLQTWWAKNVLTPTFVIGGQTTTGGTRIFYSSDANWGTLEGKTDDYVAQFGGITPTAISEIQFPDVTFENTTGQTTLEWSMEIAVPFHSITETTTGSVTLTLPPYEATSLYGSVNSLSEKVEQFYGPRYKVENLPNQTGTVDYAAFDSRYRTKADISKKPVQLTLTQDDSFAVVYEDGTSTDLDPIRRCSLWGFSDEVVNSPIVSSFATREIAKFYGSVNGQTKLVYRANS